MQVVMEAQVLDRLWELENDQDQTNCRMHSVFGRFADTLVEIMEKQEQDTATAHSEIYWMRQEHSDNRCSRISVQWR